MKNIFFDLDGTLLPMVQDEFVKYYFGYLAKRMEKFGFEKERLIATIWKGTYAMIKNDGRMSNEDCFWALFEKEYGIPKEKYFSEFEDFYANEFNKAIAATGPRVELAQAIIEECKKQNLNIYLLTNPIFPAVGTYNRIGWAGLKPEDFLYITTYENSCHSKPNPQYFVDVLEKFNLDPKETMMVGNDALEDLSAKKAGITTYLINDCIEHKEAGTDSADYISSLEEFLAYLKRNRTISGSENKR